MEDSTIVKVTAIVSLCVLGVSALSKGIDSFILMSIASLISGLAGYEVGKTKRKA